MLFLLLDYDGTLVPIKKKPDEAHLPKRLHSLLCGLVRQSDTRVGIISGRSLADIKKIIDIREIYYAGCHGLEIEGPDVSFVHPEALNLKPGMQQLTSELQDILETVPGCIVEDKHFACAVHYRNVRARDLPHIQNTVEHCAKKFLSSALLRTGKKVYEFLPAVEWNKGNAVALLLERISENSAFPIFIGDDDTDEHAFEFIKGKGLGIKVCSNTSVSHSHASIRMESHVNVNFFLRSLIRR